MNFVAASRPISPDRPLARSVDWRKTFCVGQRINGSCDWKIVGNWRRCSLLYVGASAYSDEIEEVRGLSCGALDLEFAAEEDAARELHSQSDL